MLKIPLCTDAISLMTHCKLTIMIIDRMNNVIELLKRKEKTQDSNKGDCQIVKKFFLFSAFLCFDLRKRKIRTTAL